MWEKDPTRRNEALDCRVYARVGAAIYGLDRFSENMWAELEAQIPVVNVQEKQEFKRKKPKLQQYKTMRIDDPWL